MMTRHMGSRLGDEPRREARQWHMQRSSQPPLPAALEKEWNKWVDDPDNLSAYRRFARLHSIVRALPPPSLPSKEELHADSSEFEFDAPAPLDPESGMTRSEGLQRVRAVRNPVYIAVGCGAALTAMALILVAPRIPWPSRIAIVQARDYVTEPGALHRITLQDHSVVTLSGSAHLTVLFSEHRRHLELKQGEAYFEVRHDPQVPFEVDAGPVRITDLGTTFNVRHYSDETVVSVAEGTVAVVPQAPKASHAVSNDTQSGAGARLPRTEVKAGEEVSSDTTGEVSPAHTADLKAFTLWLYGHRLYRGRPLAKVIEDVQLYVPLQIDLDPALATFLVSGYIDQHTAEQWVRNLPIMYPPIEIDDSNPRRLHIRCRSHSCSEVPH